MTISTTTISTTTISIGDRCTACGACLATCPTAALRPAPHRPALDPSCCTGCLECVEVCPRDAIRERIA